MEVLVAAWIGSTNLGDELVFAGLRALLAQRGVAVTAVSVAPAATTRLHGIPAVGSRDLPGIASALIRADAVVFGGGGLLQDETSPFNLPYHLSRVWLARLNRTPFAGVGLGVGRLETRLGAALVRRSLARHRGLAVRDAASARLLAAIGVPGAVVAADLAFCLSPPDTGAADRLVVCLRPWSTRRGWLPVGLRRTGDDQPVDALASAVDDAAEATGLPARFVALQADRDDALHQQVAQRMRTPATCVAPKLDGILAEVGAARVVVAMRYHAVVAATLAAVPVVAIGYSTKVNALAAELGPGGRLLPWQAQGPEGLGAAAAGVLGRGDDVAGAREALRQRSQGNGDVLDQLLSAA